MPWPGPRLAERAEAAGCVAFCAGEFADHNAYFTLAEMTATTSSALVGTGIAYAFARSPFVHASAARQAHRSAPGRVFVGLGSGTWRMNERWFAMPADRPLGRMADMVGAIKAYLGAENLTTVEHAGDFYPIEADIMAPVLGPIDVPILIGAFNQGMLRTSAAVADGIIGHEMFTDRWWDEMVDPNLEAGAAAAGRDPASVRRWGWLVTAIDADDPQRAERDARLTVAFHSTVKTYETLTSMHGWDAAVGDIRAAMRRGDVEAMAAAVPQEMVDAIAVYGTPADVRQRIAGRRRLPDVCFHAAPSFMVSARRRAAYVAATIDLMATAPR